MTQPEITRPYAAPANVLAVITRIRKRNVPETINNDFLRIAGVPEAVYGRVSQALRFLGLVHEDGRATDTLRALSGTTDAQYRDLLAGTLRQAYQDDFQRVDPGQDPQPKLIDAFRPYQPRSQTSRMVTLFTGLCREAGIPVIDAPRERRMQDRKPVQKKKSPTEKAKVETDKTNEERQGSSKTIDTPGLLFGVTEEDIAELRPEDFQEVWGALGKVALARASARKRAKLAATSIETVEADDEDGNEEE